MASKERSEHILNAPFLRFDIKQQLSQLWAQDQWKLGDRNAITLLKNPDFCVVLIAMHKGARMDPHEINGPLTLQVIEGGLRFLLQDQALEVGPYSLLSLDRDIVHDLIAIDDCAFILTIIYPRN